MTPDHYWEMELTTGEVIYVQPDAVRDVNHKMASKMPIPTPTRTIPFSLIRDFRVSDRIYSTQKALEEGAAEAFNEPILYTVDSGYGYTEEVIAAKWVKKQVTTRKWDTAYSSSNAYRKLAEDSAYVTIAFRLPTHLITGNVTICTDSEVRQLERRR